jgi:hypothetical protein
MTLPVIELRRLTFSEDGPTFGALLWGIKPLCVTMEPAWRGNQHDISCVPPGRRVAQVYKSPRHGKVWRLQDVPDRDNIEFHTGNWVTDTKGCILVGQLFGFDGIVNSTRAMDMLRGKLPDHFILDIINPT